MVTFAKSRNFSEKSQRESEKKSQMAVAKNQYCDAKKYRGWGIFVQDKSTGKWYLIGHLRGRCL